MTLRRRITSDIPENTASIRRFAVVVVPFTIETWAGFGECRGLVRDDGENLVLEFQVSDSVAGLLKLPLKQVRVPIRALASVQLTKGWLGTTWLGVTIVLQGTSLETFKALPTASAGRVELRIAGKDAAWAEKFVAGLHENDATS
jgi:hypothetical protein